MRLAQQVQRTPRTGEKQGRPSVSRARPCLGVLRSLSPSAPKPDSQQEGKNAPKRIIQWLLGKKIVNVLVPFTKPQPKKVTYKIPERKQRCSLWLRLSSCGRELWPGGHPRDGGSGNRMGPDHPSKSRLEISAVGRALTTEAAADSQGCAHRPEAWINRKALVRNQHTSQLPHLPTVQRAVPLERQPGAVGSSPWGHTLERS